MNALVTLESILTPAAAPLSAETLFGTGQVETIVSAIEAQVRAEVIDISTEAGRDAAKSLAHKIARSKGVLDEIGKEHVAEIKKLSGAIDAERKTLRDRLDALKAEVRGPVERWEEDEEKRVRAIEATLVCIIESPTILAGASPHSIRDRIAAVAEYTTRDWQEFKERADAAITETLPKLNAMLAAAEQRERDAAELEALRKEKAERDARDAADRQRLAQEAAEKERQARREQEERDRLAQLEQWKAEQEAKAKREAEEAAARAVEQERARVAAEDARKAAEKAAQEAAERKKQENKRHRQKIETAIFEALAALPAMDDGAAAQVLALLVAGRIPHVSITY